jgi:hypothetical protein
VVEDPSLDDEVALPSLVCTPELELLDDESSAADDEPEDVEVVESLDAVVVEVDGSVGSDGAASPPQQTTHEPSTIVRARCTHA